jgi:hypothetical protein
MTEQGVSFNFIRVSKIVTYLHQFHKHAADSNKCQTIACTEM